MQHNKQQNMKKITIFITALLMVFSCTKEQVEPTQVYKTIETKLFIFNTITNAANNTWVNDTAIYSAFTTDFQFVRTMAKGDSIKIKVFSNRVSQNNKLNIVYNGLVIKNIEVQKVLEYTFKYE